MDSLADILSNKDFSPPDEVRAIKTYVADQYGSDIVVKVSSKDIIVMSRSAALISNLRANAPALQKASGSSKRIRFRIG